jgi:hypothetical protein
VKVAIVRSPMSFSEWEIETPCLPRVGDTIQLWSHDRDIKTFNCTVEHVMFAGEQKRIKGNHYFKAKVGIMVHVREH